MPFSRSKIAVARLPGALLIDDDNSTAAPIVLAHPMTLCSLLGHPVARTSYRWPRSPTFVCGLPPEWVIPIRPYAWMRHGRRHPPADPYMAVGGFPRGRRRRRT